VQSIIVNFSAFRYRTLFYKARKNKEKFEIKHGHKSSIFRMIDYIENSIDVLNIFTGSYFFMFLFVCLFEFII